MKSLSWFTPLFLLCVSLVPREGSAQIPVESYNTGADANLFIPQVTTKHLSDIISTTSFVKLEHPDFPNHSVTIKKSNFCDPTVDVYTGYFDVSTHASTRHFFYYFFTNRGRRPKDDIMMWLSGGPGCSSAAGLFAELGPCLIDMKNISSNGTVWNPNGWNQAANIFFLDQPIGAGFSYSDSDSDMVSTTEEASKDTYAFLKIFFDHFPQFKAKPFHIAGESYAGRYIPVFASEIVDRNIEDSKNNKTITINLKSVLIGNGLTDIGSIYPGRYQVECSNASVPDPLQNISTCIKMEQELPHCQERLNDNCINNFDSYQCNAAVDFCENEVSGAFYSSGRNVYDVTKMCVGSLCYPQPDVIAAYLNSSKTRALIGANLTHPANFLFCSFDVNNAFARVLDFYAHPTQVYVAGLLEHHIRVLIYAGTLDWICNWVSNSIWPEELEWVGKQRYNEARWRSWTVNGKEAGRTKSAGPLTFASIYGAGHLISIHFVVTGPFGADSTFSCVIRPYGQA